jgi:uncharacterized protein (TIGR00251 family)
VKGDDLAVTVRSEGGETVVRFEVRAKPRASKSKVLGVREGVLDVSLAAAPVDGEANRELVETLARALGVPRRDVAIVRGDASRAKLVEVRGVTADELRARLPGG